MNAKSLHVTRMSLKKILFARIRTLVLMVSKQVVRLVLTSMNVPLVCISATIMPRAWILLAHMIANVQGWWIYMFWYRWVHFDSLWPNAICNNTIALYVCNCLDGFDGDGWTCEGENECLDGSSVCNEDATYSKNVQFKVFTWNIISNLAFPRNYFHIFRLKFAN